MLSVKNSTKSWSPAQQESSLRSDGAKSLSATEKEKVLGDQDLGEYLNKIADPNWVDPSKTRRVGNPNLDKDAFLKLFLAQLKNQDPMNPMESHELAAQLAQFTSLEKLNNIDEGIASMVKKDDPRKSYDALNLIGRAVAGDSSKIIRTDDKATHEIGFTLAQPAEEVEFSVKNSAGEEVKKLVAKGLKAGQNKITWNGELENAQGAPQGEYNVTITGKNSFGQKIAAETRFQGKVTGVNFTAEGPVLMLGKQTIAMKEVKRIFDPAELTGETYTADAQAFAGKDANNLSSKAVGMAGNLENVGMSQDLINKIEKDAQAKQSQENKKADQSEMNQSNNGQTATAAQASGAQSASAPAPVNYQSANAQAENLKQAINANLAKSANQTSNQKGGITR